MLKPPLGSLPIFEQSQPAALWLMNEGSGNIIQDLSGNGNNGTFDANPTWVASELGHAIAFDGTDDIINCGSNEVLQTANLTVEVWAKIPAAQVENNGAIVALMADIGGNGWELVIRKSDNQIWWANPANFASHFTGKIPTVGQLFHLVMTYDSAVGTKIYYDSVLIDSDGNTGALTYTDPSTLGIGGRTDNTGLDFTGDIAKCAIFNRAFSASEIVQLYIDPFPWFRQDPIELWAAATAGGAATETLNAGSVDQINAIWTDPENIIGQYNATKTAARVEQDGVGDYSGDMLLENPVNTPSAVNHFKIIYWDSAAAQDNDVFRLQFYDLDSTSWIDFTDWAVLPNVKTEYIDGDNLGDIQTKFAAAANKTNWINAFGVRFFIDVVDGSDGIIISTFGIEMEIEYTPSAGGPRGPLGQPLHGPFGGPIS